MTLEQQLKFGNPLRGMPEQEFLNLPDSFIEEIRATMVDGERIIAGLNRNKEEDREKIIKGLNLNKDEEELEEDEEYDLFQANVKRLGEKEKNRLELTEQKLPDPIEFTREIIKLRGGAPEFDYTDLNSSTIEQIKRGAYFLKAVPSGLSPAKFKESQHRDFEISLFYRGERVVEFADYIEGKIKPLGTIPFQDFDLAKYSLTALGPFADDIKLRFRYFIENTKQITVEYLIELQKDESGNYILKPLPGLRSDYHFKSHELRGITDFRPHIHRMLEAYAGIKKNQMHDPLIYSRLITVQSIVPVHSKSLEETELKVREIDIPNPSNYGINENPFHFLLRIARHAGINFAGYFMDNMHSMREKPERYSVLSEDARFWSEAYLSETIDGIGKIFLGLNFYYSKDGSYDNRSTPPQDFLNQMRTALPQKTSKFLSQQGISSQYKHSEHASFSIDLAYMMPDPLFYPLLDVIIDQPKPGVFAVRRVRRDPVSSRLENKELVERVNSIFEEHRNETRQIYDYRPLLFEVLKMFGNIPKDSWEHPSQKFKRSGNNLEKVVYTDSRNPLKFISETAREISGFDFSRCFHSSELLEESFQTDILWNENYVFSEDLALQLSLHYSDDGTEKARGEIPEDFLSILRDLKEKSVPLLTYSDLDIFGQYKKNVYFSMRLIPNLKHLKEDNHFPYNDSILDLMIHQTQEGVFALDYFKDFIKANYEPYMTKANIKANAALSEKVLISVKARDPLDEDYRLPVRRLLEIFFEVPLKDFADERIYAKNLEQRVVSQELATAEQIQPPYQDPFEFMRALLQQYYSLRLDINQKFKIEKFSETEIDFYQAELRMDNRSIYVHAYYDVKKGSQALDGKIIEELKDGGFSILPSSPFKISDLTNSEAVRISIDYAILDEEHMLDKHMILNIVQKDGKFLLEPVKYDSDNFIEPVKQQKYFKTREIEATCLPDDYRPYLHRMFESLTGISRAKWHDPSIYSKQNETPEEVSQLNLKQAMDYAMSTLFTASERKDLDKRMKVEMRLGKWQSIPRLNVGLTELPAPGNRELSEYDNLVAGGYLIIEQLTQLNVMSREEAEAIVTRKMINHIIHNTKFQRSRDNALVVLQSLKEIQGMYSGNSKTYESAKAT